jgi:DNA invertase Pin-like site-specific DNA recombinase
MQKKRQKKKAGGRLTNGHPLLFIWKCWKRFKNDRNAHAYKKDALKDGINAHAYKKDALKDGINAHAYRRAALKQAS